MTADPAPSKPRPLEVPAPVGEPRTDAVRKLLAIVDRLRAPDGCPWDRTQTLETLAPHLVEEAHELQEAIENGDDAHAAEEAGDLLMGLALVARVASETGRFDFAAVADGVSEKLVRRHPHVFGGAEAADPEAALNNWEAIKRAERRERGESEGADTSAIAGVPVSLPALQRARRLGGKAISAGFRWSDVGGAFAKLEEEVAELRAALSRADLPPTGSRDPATLGDEHRAELESELGDVLLAGALLGCYLRVDPERALRASIRRFERRFRHMEAGIDGPLEERGLDELLAAWSAAKLATAETDEGSGPESR